MSRSTINSILRHPALIVWALYLASIPFYVAKSGLPQPSNVLLVILLPVVLSRWDRRIDPGAARAIRALILFVLWVAIVNYGWAFLSWNWALQDYALHPMYYVFNGMLFFLVLVLYRQYGVLMLRMTAYSIIVIVLFQVAVSSFVRGDGGRAALFFNNPNQLGYYALLAACALAMVQRRAGVGRLGVGAAITGCAYLAIISASRAAAVGIGMLFVVLVFSNPKLIVAGALAALLMLVVGGEVGDDIEMAQQRADLQKDGGFSKERGYDRLWEHKEYMLLGAGEGDFERFSSTPSKRGRGREIHSSAATVLFSYGIIGACLFLSFGFRVIRKADPRILAMLVPTIAYTIAHQGLRFTMLWILLALFMVVKPPSTSPSGHTLTPMPTPRGNPRPQVAT